MIFANWMFLAGAIALEVAGTTSMKLSEGFTRATPSALIFVFYALSFGCLTMALRTIPVSVAYAVWSGTGTALIALIGYALFHEAMTPAKLLAIALIVVGVVGLNLASESP